MNHSHIPLSQRTNRHVYRRQAPPPGLNRFGQRPIPHSQLRMAPPTPAPPSRNSDWSGRSDNAIDIHEQNQINTGCFKMEDFTLHACRHNARVHLRHKKCPLTLDRLSPQNKEQLIASLCEYYDLLKPTEMRTTCANNLKRTRHQTHFWDMLYENNSASYLNVFNCIVENDDKRELMLHWKTHTSNYLAMYNVNLLKHLQNDLKKYIQKHQFHHWQIGGKRRGLRSFERCSNDIRFDLNSMQIPCIYLNFDTDNDKYNFKMANYKQEVGEMVDTLLQTHNTVSKLFVEMSGFKEIKWFDIRIRSYEKKNGKNLSPNYANSQVDVSTNYREDDDFKSGEDDPGKMCIKVTMELHVSMFLFYMNIFQMRWIKQGNNEKRMYKWWNDYCSRVNKTNLQNLHRCHEHHSKWVFKNSIQSIADLKCITFTDDINIIMPNDSSMNVIPTSAKVSVNTLTNDEDSKTNIDTYTPHGGFYNNNNDSNNNNCNDDTLNDANGVGPVTVNNNTRQFHCPLDGSLAMAIRRSRASPDVHEKIAYAEKLIAFYEKELVKQRNNLKLLKKSLLN